MKSFYYFWIKNNPLVRKIKYFLFPKRYMMSNYNRRARRVTSILYNYFEEHDSSIYALQITDVNVNYRKHTVTITLGRPGLLIGKAGRHIDAISILISDMFLSEMHIIIKESYIF